MDVKVRQIEVVLAALAALPKLQSVDAVMRKPRSVNITLRCPGCYCQSCGNGHEKKPKRRCKTKEAHQTGHEPDACHRCSRKQTKRK